MVVDSRRRNLWPLPGGVSSYPTTAQRMLKELGAGKVRRDYEHAIRKSLPNVTSTSTVRGYVSVLVTLGLAEKDGARLRPTPDGRRFARTADLKILRQALVREVYGVAELLCVLRDSPDATYRDLEAQLEQTGVFWQNPWHFATGSGGS